MDTTWPSEWLRGALEMMALAVISEGETYGYLIASRLEEAGMGTIKGGTLYPILNRLEAAGALTSQWRQGDGGPGRKYYSLTPAGTARLDTQRDQWHQFTERTSTLLSLRSSIS
ncbi:PadR family transcriptional regulator PadR [Microbacterium resistens]|uniref:PadR family transcriptional regulator PadR n=1 Tax=Microbacterium resistens TaxID=156977 RepID=A0ABU1SDM3_9MICO|nr:PadR family transcriptional regulator [Microbacterium resistens]MDR6867717.1 PadR family transcriptional regulator PadR [Microbacterium resistens]